jgi:hypothetical protein
MNTAESQSSRIRILEALVLMIAGEVLANRQ